jgi:hypothetical protein
MFSHRATPFFLALLILALPFLNSPGGVHGAQTKPVQPPPSAVADPPGTIDGAKNPELIPDDVAYRLIFLAFAMPEDATAEQKARARGKINSIGFNDDDADAFLRLLAEFHKGLVPIDTEVAEIYRRSPILSPYSTDAARVRELGKQREKLVGDTIAALPARLSPEGVARLQAYLQQAKRGMKIIPDSSVKTPMN